MREAVADPLLGRLARIEAWALRAPIATPVVTSFGTMRDRPAVFVRVTDTDGAEGWGEAWCNFPGVGAEHRARLLIDTVAPLALGPDWADVPSLWRSLESRLRVLAIQTGEPGPLAQCAAAVDLAAWDLVARRAGSPLWRALGGNSGVARVYASGLHPAQAMDLARTMHDRGHRAFKLKVGFEPGNDRDMLAALRSMLGPDVALMVDANQAWSTQAARERIAMLAPSNPRWIEEPIAADHDPPEWAALSEAVPVPLAAGENLRGVQAFDALLASGALGFVQPDVGKWGGFSGCREVARHAAGLGACYCPHWLGGPLGLLASMHLRAAMGDDGWVEWDANPNPIHDRVSGQLPVVLEGRISLSDAPGLGVALHIEDFDPLVQWQGTAS
ncbi:MAG: mandelate racemase/muconate lactonizing enzyme family protein [Proteobacteria bacterium]|jgi:L-alanine-DL-glutamate epimerase-like enolase superfamily enzyme|nr:mandelate racemase/muconate lactonizing enzyme family protein [Pseudomonadota bacterium]MBS0461525.1 mandelate racemase/muconate lactonizing enzyme family protein [Pseudomonadota bacterium]